MPEVKAYCALKDSISLVAAMNSRLSDWPKAWTTCRARRPPGVGLAALGGLLALLRRSESPDRRVWPQPRLALLAGLDLCKDFVLGVCLFVCLPWIGEFPGSVIAAGLAAAGRLLCRRIVAVEALFCYRYFCRPTFATSPAASVRVQAACIQGLQGFGGGRVCSVRAPLRRCTLAASGTPGRAVLLYAFIAFIIICLHFSITTLSVICFHVTVS